MQLSKSQEVFSRVTWFEEIDSTNLELERQLESDALDFSAVIANSQSGGRGRLGRQWQSPPGSSLSLSILLTGPHSQPGWLTLLAALAIKQSLEVLGVKSAGIKWPNDVLVEGRKISGILAQLLPSGAVIIGIGLNLGKQQEALNAVSLEELGIEADLDEVAALIGSALKNLLAEFASEPERVKERFGMACVTLGQNVRAELPEGSELYGMATAIDDSGQLVILTPEPRHLSAGDVWHLRS
jgi:BirA family transcriptional regulator, biotin operon repressor / biotin---[acetyl-CoA-carboxylase] ligase